MLQMWITLSRYVVAHKKQLKFQLQRIFPISLPLSTSNLNELKETFTSNKDINCIYLDGLTDNQNKQK